MAAKKIIFFIVFLALNYFYFLPNPLFASSYYYIDPVDVGQSPLRTPPTDLDLKDQENKSPEKFSNNIDKDSSTCSFTTTVSEDINLESKYEDELGEDGNIIKRFIGWIEKWVNQIQQSKSAPREYTNFSFRDSHLHFAKDPVIRINSTTTEDAEKFKQYDQKGQNASVRSLPNSQKLVIKGKHIEEAAMSLTKKENIIPTDEQLAWDCNGTCTDLFDKNNNKPTGCRPIYISEVGYYYYSRSIPTSFKLENNTAVPIPLDSRAVSVFSSYSTYRPSFTGFISSSCYEKLYLNLPVIPRGTVNTKVVFNNIGEQGQIQPTPGYRALPLAAPISSQELDSTLKMYLPNEEIKNIQPNPASICNKTTRPQMLDKTSNFSIIAFLKNLAEYLTEPKRITKTIRVDEVVPPAMVKNIAQDEALMSDLIPASDHATYNLKAAAKSSATSEYPDPGLKESNLRKYFSNAIIPKLWQINNPRPAEPGGITAPGNISATVPQWCDLINKYAAMNNLDPALIAAQMTVESGGNSNAISYQGAVGLLQIMPSDNSKGYNFMCDGRPCFSERPTTAQLLNPEFNIKYGTSLLASLIKIFGSIRDGLKHYGPVYGTPERAYEYADIILNLYKQNPNTCK